MIDRCQGLFPPTLSLAEKNLGNEVGEFNGKNQYRMNHEGMSTISVFLSKIYFGIYQFGNEFFLNCISFFKEKAISESLFNSQGIGIMLKLEAIKKLCQFMVCVKLFKLIHILMYFIETHQVNVGLDQESSKYSNATKKGRPSNKSYGGPQVHSKFQKLPCSFTRDWVEFF